MNDGFSKHRYLKAIRGQALKPAVYRVLVTMTTYADQHGRKAHPGVARLAADCGCSERTVKRHLATLCELGWLRQDHRGGRAGDGTAYASTYSLTEPPAVPDVPEEAIVANTPTAPAACGNETCSTPTESVFHNGLCWPCASRAMNNLAASAIGSSALVPA